MRCSSCYAENPAFLKRCRVCGRPTRPLEFCPAGHLLDPDAAQCRACASLWPDVPPFAGPPILRAVLWPDRGEFTVAGSDGTLPFVELRDGESPVSLIVEAAQSIAVHFDNPAGASAKILTRPEGISCCLGAQLRTAHDNTTPAYRPLAASDRLWLGDVPVHIARLDVPSFALRS